MDFGGEGFDGTGGVQKHDPRGIFFRQIEVTCANGDEEFLTLALDAVELAVAGLQSSQRGLTVEVENEGDIRQASSHGEGVDA